MQNPWGRKRLRAKGEKGKTEKQIQSWEYERDKAAAKVRGASQNVLGRHSPNRKRHGKKFKLNTTLLQKLFKDEAQYSLHLS